MTGISAIRRRLSSRVAMVLALAVVAAIAAAAVVGAKIVLPKLAKTRAMCAEFNDAVGLYPGNKVALLGIEVGKVTAVTNMADHVQVDFSVPKDLDLPADVGAVTYSQSIVTDRNIELTKPYAGGPKFTGPQCINLRSTKTPIGVGETFSALGKLADAILGPEQGQDPSAAPGVQALNDSLKAASRSLAGTGPELNQTLRDLATMVGDPARSDAAFRQLFANSEAVTSLFLEQKNWDSFATLIQTLPDTAKLIEGLSDNFASALEHVVHLLPILVDALNRFAPRVYLNLTDKIIPWVGANLAAYSQNIAGVINGVQPYTDWLGSVYHPAWAHQNVTYAPGQVEVSPQQANDICAVLRQRNTPGGAAACAPGTASNPASLGLADLILGAGLP